MRTLAVALAAAASMALPVADASASTVTASVTKVAQTQAYFVVSGNADATSDVYFDWGRTTAYGTSDRFYTAHPAGAVGPSAGGNMGLLPGTTYHMRARMVDVATQATVVSPDMTFTTSPHNGDLLDTTQSAFTGAGSLADMIPVSSPWSTCGDAPLGMGSDAVTRYRAFAFVNATAAKTCVTVHLSSTCMAIRSAAYAGAFAGTAYANALGAAFDGGEQREYQFEVAAGAPFSVLVADDGSCSGFGLRVDSTALVPPSVATAAPTGLAPTSATLNGTGTARLVRGVTARFEYGTSTAYGMTVAAGALPADGQQHALSALVTGLKPGTTYHVRAVTSGPGGTATGRDVTFRAPFHPPPLDLGTHLVGVSRAGVVALRIPCPAATGGCDGRVRLRSARKLRRTPHGKARSISFAGRRFQLAAGATGTVRLQLSKRDRRLVRQRRVVRAVAVISGVDGYAERFPTARRTLKLVWNG